MPSASRHIEALLHRIPLSSKKTPTSGFADRSHQPASTGIQVNSITSKPDYFCTLTTYESVSSGVVAYLYRHTPTLPPLQHRQQDSDQLKFTKKASFKYFLIVLS